MGRGEEGEWKERMGWAERVGRMFGIKQTGAGKRTAGKQEKGKHNRSGREGEEALEVGVGELVVVGGPSGAGKTTLLRRMERRLRAQGRSVARLEALPVHQRRPVVECLSCPTLEEALACVARAGLSEAGVLVRRPETLSAGERMRFRLAQWYAGGSEVLVADEFGASLDEVTARIVAYNLKRFLGAQRAAGRPRSAVVAGGRWHSLIQEEEGAGCSVMGEIEIERGRLRDYEELGRFHYCAGRPAVATQVWTAWWRAGGEGGKNQGGMKGEGAWGDAGMRVVDLWGQQAGEEGVRRMAGIAVVCMPVLACRLRDAATGHRYQRPDAAAAAAALNREMRCVARVIVHPTFRGMGLAVRLVRWALEHAETRYTEALAAMGRANPFFERAGMRAYRGSGEGPAYYLWEKGEPAGSGGRGLPSEASFHTIRTGHPLLQETRG